MVALEKGKGEKIGKAAELMICDQAEFERRFNEPSQALGRGWSND
jgi:hypothetical protein